MASVLVPLAEGFEEIEAVTVIDLLRRAGIEVVTAGLTPGVIRASRGTQIQPDRTLDEVAEQAFDMICLPGGQPGANHLQADERVRQRLRQMAEAEGYIAAICAAPKVLADVGLLDGRQATSYPGVLERLDRPGIELRNATVVRDGTVITSRGPGTAMDFALELIELLTDRAKRDEVESALVRPALN